MVKTLTPAATAFAAAFAAALAAALAGAIASTPALAQGEAPNDLEIAHTAYTAGNIDIRYAHLALALSDSPEVRQFAETMIRDHTAVNDAAVALIHELDVTPQDNDLSRALADAAAAQVAALRGLDGDAFDCAYAQNELAYHQLVNQTVEQTFIPNATVPQLRDLLASALVTFRVHEGHAADLVAGLECGT